jgi:predicted lipoprotein with Yx(FWY)xxD motif
MSRRRPLAGITLVAIVAMSGGLLVEAAAAAADLHGRRDRAAIEQKNKKKKPTVKVATTDLGDILVTTKGFTLYLFDPDGTDTVSSKCIDACAGVWPAYVATKKPRTGKGLDKSLLGVGGGGQVVYNDHFLYRFSGDAAAGETNGQGVGGVWHAVDPDGNAIP